MAAYPGATLIYMALLLIILAIIAGVSWINRKKRPPRLSNLAAAAFALIIAGIVFGQKQNIGYGLLGLGVLLAVADIIRSRPKAK